MPSRYEGIASIAFEAMATEVVVVSADVGGQKELVIEGTGVLLQPELVSCNTPRPLTT